MRACAIILLIVDGDGVEHRVRLFGPLVPLKSGSDHRRPACGCKPDTAVACTQRSDLWKRKNIWAVQPIRFREYLGRDPLARTADKGFDLFVRNQADGIRRGDPQIRHVIFQNGKDHSPRESALLGNTHRCPSRTITIPFEVPSNIPKRFE